MIHCIISMYPRRTFAYPNLGRREDSCERLQKHKAQLMRSPSQRPSTPIAAPLRTSLLALPYLTWPEPPPGPCWRTVVRSRYMHRAREQWAGLR